MLFSNSKKLKGFYVFIYFYCKKVLQLYLMKIHYITKNVIKIFTLHHELFLSTLLIITNN